MGSASTPRDQAWRELEHAATAWLGDRFQDHSLECDDADRQLLAALLHAARPR